MAHFDDNDPSKRRIIACLHCREKKVKCDGAQPCGHCAARAVDCIFPSKTQRRKYKKRLQIASSGYNRLVGNDGRRRDSTGAHAQISPVSRDDNAYSSSATRDERLPLASRVNRGDSDSSSIRCAVPTATADRPTNAISPLSNLIAEHVSPVEVSQVLTPRNTTTGTLAFSDTAPLWDLDADGSLTSGSVTSYAYDLDPQLSGSSSDESVIEPNTGSEYHGATSILAICSSVAIDWITQQTQNKEYPRLSALMASTIGAELKLRKDFSKERAPEPDFQTAWRYYEAYWQQPESSFLVIPRPLFESRLRQTFSQNGQEAEEDPAWYALRNTVYAAGKRHMLSNDTVHHSFEEIQNECWPYFENAMSVHTQLLFSPTTIVGVQALIAMAMFVEGLGSPCLEYMLCTGASRLAQSQGLHRQPPRDCRLTEAQVTQRSLLFWSIYCFDKHISIRAGRPSAIDDRDITCIMPANPTPQPGLEGVWITKTVEHARLISDINAWMAVFRSKQLPLEESIRQQRRLSSRLQSWSDSLPAPLRPASDLKRSTAAKIDLHYNQIIYTHYAYYGTTIALNCMFAWPWLADILGAGNKTLYEEQARESIALVVDAARNIIRLTHYIEIDCSTPVWMSFYYPFVAFVNLFVYVIRNPTHDSIQTDLSLLDVITGYFGRMELATTAHKSFPFVRDLSQCAHATVARYKASADQPAALASLGAGAEKATARGVVEAEISFEDAGMFPTASLMSAQDRMDLGMAMGAEAGMVGHAHPTPPLYDLEFSNHDPMFVMAETDLSWGILSVPSRPDLMSLVDVP